MRFLAVLAGMAVLAGCTTPSQDVYDYREAGRSTIVEFGTVIDVRHVRIQGQNTNTGAGVGAAAGGVAGSQFGDDTTQLVAIAGGVAAGAAAGALAEQAFQNKEGREITVITENGKTRTVAQYFKADEPIIQKGQRVMIQTSGSYQRVLPAEHLPTEIKRPQGIKLVD